MKGQKTFRGFPCKDAVAAITLPIDNDSLVDGKPMDAAFCAIAQSSKKVYGTPDEGVMVGVTTAYIVHRDEKSRWVAFRYQVNTAARRVIKANDAGKGHLEAERTITLHPPRPSQQLGKRRNVQGGKSDGRGKGGGGKGRKNIRTIRSLTGQIKLT